MDVLLIDDNRDEARLTLRTLKKISAAADIVYESDGEKAVTLIRTLQPGQFPKVILLDLKMPGLDGIGVLKLLKEDVRFKTIPIVMLTSSREESDVVRSYRLGVNAYIVKPVDLENFVNAISEIGLFWLTRNITTI